MSYTPTSWANGDTITAENLNKNEQGTQAAAAAADAATPVHVPFSVTTNAGGATGTTTATFADVAADVVAGKTVIADVTLNDGLVMFAPCVVKVPVTTPTTLLFSTVAKLVGAIENAKPTLYQISFTRDGTVGVAADELT